MSDELRWWLDDLSEDAPPVVISPAVIGRAASSRRRRRVAGRVSAAVAAGAAATASMVALVVVLSVLGPSTPVPALPAAAASATPSGPDVSDQGSAIGEASMAPQPEPFPVSPSAASTATALEPGTEKSSATAPDESSNGAPADQSRGAAAVPPAGSTTTATAPARPPVLVDAGGPGAGGFAADAGFTGGTAYSLSAAVDTTDEQSAVPALYSTVRYGASFDYGIEGLQPGSAHRLRLHWAELDFLAAGDRVFDVSVNGLLVLDGMDVVKATGTFRRVLVREVDVVADPSGRVVVQFRPGGKDNPFISGLELLPR